MQEHLPDYLTAEESMIANGETMSSEIVSSGPSRKFAIGLMIVLSLSWIKAQAQTDPEASQNANEGLLAPLSHWWEHAHFLKWATAKNASLKAAGKDPAAPAPDDFDEPLLIDVPQKGKIYLNPEDVRRLRETSKTYFNMFGHDTVSSLVWTGIEAANPLTKDESYRWNSLREEGMYDHDRRIQLATKLKTLGIRNLRLGISNHEIDLNNEASWQATSDMIDDFSSAGIGISLDLHHFGIENRFKKVDSSGKEIPEQSYYLNPEWPDYFAAFARKAIDKYHGKIKAVTIMNEPETVVGFNGEMWHGGFPGWSSQMTNFWYIARCLQVAKASVKARIQIEEYLASLPASPANKIVYVHTEASVYKPYWEEFNLYRRFIISDMILGNDWLVTADLKKLSQDPITKIESRWQTLADADKTELDWLIQNYVVVNQAPRLHEQLRQSLFKKVGELQALHHELKSRFNKTMRTDTVLAADYYAQNEDRDKNLSPLRWEPQFYASEIVTGKRSGLYPVIVDYFNHFKMPMMIGETGTAYNAYGLRWNEQMLLDCAKAAHGGIPFLAFTVYPATDTWGWESALSLPRATAIYNPSGLFDSQLQARPFVSGLLTSLRQQMSP